MSLNNRTFRLSENANGLGLSCTVKGISLAGVPLLRKTVVGLTPRSNEEIRALMKVAYDRDIDSTRMSAGLEVIAKALNQNDLGRAMVASLCLRLPEVSPSGASRLAAAHDFLTKYDPNEPRDALGRWTSGDGSLSNNLESDETPRSASSEYSLKPIPVSGPPAANDNIPLMDRIDPPLISGLLTHMCMGNARDPDYQTKMESCLDAHEKCLGLIKLGEKFPRREDFCQWPDGTEAFVKGGMVFPIAHGKPW